MEEVRGPEPDKVRVFLDRGFGYGSGDGSGDGSGYGYSDGDGSGDGYGSGSGSGSGYGSGSGSGDGYGYGSGSGSGSGDGSGDGYGDGSGYGSGFSYSDGCGVENINGWDVYKIDGVPTVLYHIHGNVARGAILRNDLTLKPCYIVKGGGYFTHGETLREAMAALTDKIMEDMPEEERIAAFVRAHPDYRRAWPNRDLYDWHHRLTGSCEMGRNAFVSDKGLSLDGETTVEDFVRLTKNAYGGSTIRKLPAAYGEPWEVQLVDRVAGGTVRAAELPERELDGNWSL